MSTLGVLLLACARRRSEDRPDRAAAVVAVADPGHGGVDPVGGIEAHVLGVEVAVMLVGVDALVAVGAVLPARLVIEALAQRVDRDDVLPVRDMQAGGAGLA